MSYIGLSYVDNFKLLNRVVREQRFVIDVQSILGYDPVSIGKHFSDKLISRSAVVVGKPCSLFCFLTDELKKTYVFSKWKCTIIYSIV